MAQKAPPHEYRFSLVDWKKTTLVESVRVHQDTELVIRYCCWNWSTGLASYTDEYFFEEYGKTYYPPVRLHPLLVKQHLLIPNFDYPPESIPVLIKHLNEDKITEEINAFISRWLVLTPQQLTVLTGFTKFTWVHERSDVKPYLNIHGEKGTGKSSVAETALVYLCRYAQYYGGAITPSSLLRSVDELGGTSMIDESDFKGESESDQLLMRILRGGYRSSGSYSLSEASGRTHVPTIFSIGNPKIIIGRRVIHDDALRSRCLDFEMQPITIPLDKRRPSEAWFDRERRANAQAIVDRLLLYRLKRFGDHNEPASDLMAYEARLTDTAQAIWYCLHNDEERKHYLAFVKDNAEGFHTQMADTIEGYLLKIIARRLEAGYEDLSLKELVKFYREQYKEEYDERALNELANSRKFMWRLKGMGITTRHRDTGSVVMLKLQEDIIIQLCNKYGVPCSVDVPLTGPAAEEALKNANLSALL